MKFMNAQVLAAVVALLSGVSLITQPAASAAEVREREIDITGRFLFYPVGERRAENEMPVLELLAPGQDGGEASPLRRWIAPLSGKAVIDWKFSDVAGVRGQKLILRVSNYRDEQGGWDMIRVADEFMPRGFTGEDGTVFHQLYREPGRPQFHFTAMRGWINDPNGLVYANGRYHLFYQFDPVDAAKSWGHAVSDDLVHWEELPVAIRPEHGTQAYSGSCVVDHNNVSGMKSPDNEGDLIIAYYTLVGRGERMAYSNDDGLTFTHGPVLEDGLRHPPEHNGRDPKVIWHEPTQRWIAVIFDRRPWSSKPEWGLDDGHGFVFYSSKDLLRWKYESRFVAIEGPYECPELYELPVDGDPNNKKWVLQEASSRYFIGSFDGHEFKPDQMKDGWPVGFMQSLSGTHYAAQTWSNIPESDGRRIQIAWGRFGGNKHWERQMLFPCELSLRTTKDGPRLFTNPVGEIANLYKEPVHRWTDVALEKGKKASFDVDEELLDLTLVLRADADAAIDLNVHGHRQRLGVNDNGTGPFAARNGRIQLRLLKDRGCMEIYAFGGEVYLPLSSNIAHNNRELSLTLIGGEAKVESLEVHGLTSIWFPDE